METNNSTIATLHQLLDYEARQFTASEIQLKHNLLEWIKQAGSMQLKTVLHKYLGYIEEHLHKLEDILKGEQLNFISIEDRIMKAYVDDANEKMRCCIDAEVKDASLLASIQMINHFKISVYGTAAAFAKTLEMEKAATTFHEMEINEKQIDDRLSQLAEFEINNKARAAILLRK